MHTKNVIFKTFTAILFSVNFIHAQNNEIWKWFTPKGENFEVIVPREMKSGLKNVVTDIGTMHPVTWLCEGVKDEPNYLYMLSYVDYPEGVIHSDSMELLREILKESMQAHIEDLKATLVYDGTLDYGANPGIVYRASLNNELISVKCRMMIIGNRFYTLQVYCHAIRNMNNEMDRYLMSFRIK